MGDSTIGVPHHNPDTGGKCPCPSCHAIPDAGNPAHLDFVQQVGPEWNYNRVRNRTNLIVTAAEALARDLRAYNEYPEEDFLRTAGIHWCRLVGLISG